MVAIIDTIDNTRVKRTTAVAKAVCTVFSCFPCMSPVDESICWKSSAVGIL